MDTGELSLPRALPRRTVGRTAHGVLFVGATVCVEVLFVGWVELAKPIGPW